MPKWELPLQLDATLAQPLFLQIARGIADGIKAGRLRPGQKLPGTRALADTLAVHRNTVIAAYDELVAEGWLESRATGGTYVSGDLPDVTPSTGTGVADTASARPKVGLAPGPTPASPEAGPLPPGDGILHLAGTDADLRLLPLDALARAYRRVLLTEGPSVLNTGDPRGHLRLRMALAEMLQAMRAVNADPEGMIVTRGSQMALYLAARALVRPGDVVAIEALGYRPAWEAFQAAGARLVPVPVDAQGLDVAALARVPDVRAVYLTPHHHYPTTVTLSPGRRLQLLELAAARGIAVVEDDYDNEFHYDGRPILPLASADPGVVYVGTLSKILAPGLRLGYVAAPAPLVARMAAIRHGVDGQGDHAVECAVAALLADREVQRHAHRMRRAYKARRAALVDALARHLPGALSATPPAGGMALWAHAAPAIDLAAWVTRGLAAGVAFGRPRPFAFEGPEPQALRLGFAALAPEELDEAVRRMAAVL